MDFFKAWVPRFAAGLMMLSLGCATSNPPQKGAEIGAQEAQLYGETFDAIAEIVGEHSAHLMHEDLNWDEISATYRMRALKADDQMAFYAIVNEMLAELEISHTVAIPPSVAAARKNLQAPVGYEPIDVEAQGGGSAEAGEGKGAKASAGGQDGQALPEVPGEDGLVEDGPSEMQSTSKMAGKIVGDLDFRWVNDGLYIFEVPQDSPEAAAGLRPGLKVLEMDGIPVAFMWEMLNSGPTHGAEAALRMRETALALLNRGPGADGHRMVTEDPHGQWAQHRFEMSPQDGADLTFGHLTVRASVQHQSPTPDVGYLKFNVFMMELMPDLSAAIGAFSDKKGIILDLRGNLGGIAGMSQALSAHLITEKVNLGMMQNDGFDVKFPVYPRAGAFDEKLVILVDGASASTSEIMAVGLQEAGKAHIIGTQTAGLVLPSLIVQLPDGGLLQYATALYRSAAGVVIEGIGVTPDVVIPADIEAWYAGRDPVLDAAIQWIEGEK